MLTMLIPKAITAQEETEDNPKKVQNFASSGLYIRTDSLGCGKVG